MKRLLDCFDYIKRYHSDMLDVLSIMFELFIFKKENAALIHTFITKAKKRQPIKDEFLESLQDSIGTLYTPINKALNILKVLKVLDEKDISISDVELFLHIISQKKTIHKLYYCSTPKEVNNLLILLLELENNDSIYNPCYGIGSIFLSIGQIGKNIKLYGEELDIRLSNIARLIARYANITDSNLFVNDILRQPSFKDGGILRQFDKVLCNPPLYVHVGIEQLKEDERFSKSGILAKNYPELAFLTHAISHLKKRGVFIVRNQTLQKSFLGEKLKDKLIKERMLESVIELPKNIFPNQSHDFSILIISHDNNKILNINANNKHFYIKDGKHNRLVRIQEIVDIYKDKKEGNFSKLTNIEDIKIHDLRASYYVARPQDVKNSYRLGDMIEEIFRGQRVYGSNKDSDIAYYDIGIADFSHCGFTANLGHKKLRGDVKKIHKYRLRSHDILLSIRGAIPKITILDKGVDDNIVVANAGILILRMPSINEAISLYCYFFSKKGFDCLSHIYEKSGDTLNINEILDIRIPLDYMANSLNMMKEIEKVRLDFEILERKLNSLKG